MAARILSEAGHQAVLGRTLSREDIKRLCRRQNRQAAFHALTQLRLVLELSASNQADVLRAATHRLPMGALRSSLTDAIVNRKIDGLASPQTLTASQSALLIHARDSEGTASLEDLLILIMACSDEVAKSTPAEKARTPQKATSLLYAMTSRCVPDASREIIVRTWKIYVELWDAHAARSETVPFRQLFRDACSLEVETFLAFAFLTAEVVLADGDDSGNRESPSLSFQRFSDTLLERDDYERLICLLSTDQRTASPPFSLEDWTSGRWATNDDWQTRTPIVRLPDGDIVSSAKALTMAAAEGVFWAVAKRLNSQQRKHLFRDRGLVFEQYVRSVAMAGWAGCELLSGALKLGEAAFECDCIVIDGSTCLIAECTAAVPSRESRNLGSPGLLDYLPRVINKIVQAADRLAAVSRSKSVSDGSGEHLVETAQAIVVLLYSSPTSLPFTTHTIREMALKRAPRIESYLSGIYVMSIGEFEALASIESLQEVAMALTAEAQRGGGASTADVIAQTWGEAVNDGSRKRLEPDYGRITKSLLRQLHAGKN